MIRTGAFLGHLVRWCIISSMCRQIVLWVVVTIIIFMVWSDAVWFGVVVSCGAVRLGMRWHLGSYCACVCCGVAWCGVVWCGVVWRGVLW